MRSIKDIIGNLVKEKPITSYCCLKCKVEVRCSMIQVLGGKDKGKWVERKTECHCDLARQTLEAHDNRMISFYDRYSDINDDLKESGIHNFEPINDSAADALQKSMDYIENFDKSNVNKLMFHGDVGRGKSHLAIGIYKSLKIAGHSAIFFESNKLLQTIKDTWDKDNAMKTADFLKAMKDVDLLIIDDLGSEKISEWAEDMLFTVFNNRIGKSLVVTTNLNAEEIAVRYGDRIADRIFDKMRREDLVKIETNFSYRQRFLEE